MHVQCASIQNKRHKLCMYTEKTMFQIPFILNGIWSWWQFSFRFWTKWDSIWFKIEKKTVTTIISHSIWKETKYKFFSHTDAGYYVCDELGNIPRKVLCQWSLLANARSDVSFVSFVCALFVALIMLLINALSVCTFWVHLSYFR